MLSTNVEGDPLLKTIDHTDTMNDGVEHVAPSVVHDVGLLALFIESAADKFSSSRSVYDRWR